MKNLSQYKKIYIYQCLDFLFLDWLSLGMHVVKFFDTLPGLPGIICWLIKSNLLSIKTMICFLLDSPQNRGGQTARLFLSSSGIGV
jgi:hypothetical protein